jgi:uncharacterized protein with FMN-binding domain
MTMNEMYLFGSGIDEAGSGAPPILAAGCIGNDLVPIWGALGAGCILVALLLLGNMKFGRAKKTNGAIAMLGLVFALAGCSSLTPAEIKSYLDGIPVTTPDLSAKPDGAYSGSYTLAIPPGEIAFYNSFTVAVTVKIGRMDSISVTKPKDFEKDELYAAMITGPAGVIAKQTLDVDALSGASYSSKALLKAVEIALSP